MIEAAIEGLLILLGLVFLTLAGMLVWQAWRRKRDLDRVVSTTEESADPKISNRDVEEFIREMEDAAPAMLQHLVRFRQRVGPRGVVALAGAYLETPGMEIRKKALRGFLRIYGVAVPSDQDLRDMMDDLSELRDGVFSKELYDEIRRTSPAQLAVQELLRELFRATQVRVMKWRSRLGEIPKTVNPVFGSDVDGDFAQLLALVSSLGEGLASSLPRDKVKDKSLRQKLLTESLSQVRQFCDAYQQQISPRLRSLPEGILCEACLDRLWSGMNDLLIKSGGVAMSLPSLLGAVKPVRAGGTSGSFRIPASSMALSGLALLLFAGAGFVKYGSILQGFSPARTVENTVEIVTEEALGSGFFVKGFVGLIVTNHHVVASEETVTVRVKRKGDASGKVRSLRATVLAVDQGGDVAILGLSQESVLTDLPRGLRMARGSSFEPGQTVHVVGNPQGMENVYVQGTVSKVQDGFAWIDANIAPGNSGGPVCDRRGVVIGIMTAKRRREDFSLGVAISTSAAWRLIESLRRATPDHAADAKRGPSNPAAKVNLLGPFPDGRQGSDGVLIR